MAKQDATTFTPHRPIRMSQPRWDAFGALVGMRERAKVINAFVAWFNREPGAQLPERPKLISH
jgi:hypothetical protein